MKVSSLSGAASATRNAMLHTLNQTSAGAANTGTASPLARPVAMAPPPRTSSFGGADPRAMFEALVQKFDADGDGKLSMGEVNALNQGGLLTRSFGRIDSNADGTISGDEVAHAAPWAASLPASGDQGGGEQGADVRPLFDKLHSNRDAALIAGDMAAIRRAEFAQGMASVAGGAQGVTAAQTLAKQTLAAGGVTRAPDPATLMESMVLALSTDTATEGEAPRTGAVQPTPTTR